MLSSLLKPIISNIGKGKREMSNEPVLPYRGKAGVKLTITSREQPEASWTHSSGERPGH